MSRAAALALLSAAVLGLQVAFTRVLSLVVWYHFAFLVVAGALLGFTSGGAIVSAFPTALGTHPPRRLAQGALGFAGSTALAMLVLPRLPLGDSVTGTPGQIALFALLLALVVVPFVFAGFVVAGTFVAGRDRIPALYLASLVGSGLGAGLATVALDHLGGGPAGVLFAAVLGVLAAATFSIDAGRLAERILSALVLLATLALLVVATEPLRDPFYLPNAKVYPRVPRSDVIERRWSALSCVDLFRNPLHHGLWGVAPVYTGPLPDSIGVVIDAWAITSILRGEPISPAELSRAVANPGPGPLSPNGERVGVRGEHSTNPARARAVDSWPYRLTHPVFGWLPGSYPHLFRAATRTRARRGDRALVIGAGGGIDVRTALVFGASHVEAVEINPLIVDAVRGRFAAYSGNLYAHPRVRVVVSEGRHHLERSPDRFDFIHLSGVDTYAATQAGAFALSENHLYTVEAFSAYLDHLRPGGMVALTRWLYEPPRQTLRLATVAERALRNRGITRPWEHILVLGIHIDSPIHYSVVMVRLTPFTPGEIAIARNLARERTWYLAYAPGDERTAHEVAADQPFTRRPRAGHPNAFARYFAARDADAFIRDYPYRIEPTTDDQPFFFEHHRLSGLIRSGDAILRDGSGQLVLAITLLFALAGTALLVGVPYLRARRRLVGPPLSLDRLATFALLGLGYVLVEIVLVQRFVLFLGDPGAALSVVLSALLVSSGLGSLVARRLARSGTSDRAVVLVLLLVALVLGVSALGLAPLLRAALPLSGPLRIALAVASISAIGFLLGIPFPTLLARLGSGDDGARAVASGWVANGAASVVGSVLATFVAINAGFDAVLLSGGVAYLAAALASTWGRRRRRAPSPAGEGLG
ncbi:MAG: hypothetical protein IT379_17430 [Deltaproteobacteria bacterium]|nr:hypothetical protein [Deltaproteobacteria bacterium]